MENHIKCPVLNYLDYKVYFKCSSDVLKQTNSEYNYGIVKLVPNWNNKKSENPNKKNIIIIYSNWIGDWKFKIFKYSKQLPTKEFWHKLNICLYYFIFNTYDMKGVILNSNK